MILAALALSASAQAAKPDAEDMKYMGLADVGLVGGGSFFHDVSQGLGTKGINGGVVGISATGNFWKYIGLEFGFRHGVNNYRMLNSLAPGQPRFEYGARLAQWYLGPVFYFTPRGSKIRPYLTTALAAAQFRPTDTALDEAKAPVNSVYGARMMRESLLPLLQYGGGVNIMLTDMFGLRFDARGLWSRNPAFGLPSAPGQGVWVPRGFSQHGVQTTAGLMAAFGKKEAPPLPPPPPPKRPDPLGNLNAGSITGGDGLLCPGRPIALRSTGSDPAGKAVTYRWKINGQNVGTGQTYNFTPNRSGSYAVEVEMEAPNNEGYPVRMAKAGPMTLTVEDDSAPRITSFTASPTSVNYGDTVNLSAAGVGSRCGGALRYSYTAAEGTFTSASANPQEGSASGIGTGSAAVSARAGASTSRAAYNTTGMRFEQSGKTQNKPATITVTATDQNGRSASARASATVTYTPQAIRYSDLVFGKGSARVNNCGKRILLDELAAKAADPDYEIVLVGHIDADEAPKRALPKNVKPLDYRRVMNAAAVLTGGKGTCANIDPARVKIDWVGTEQTADMQPGLCGTSARASIKERSDVKVSSADQNRRVEVWLVPKGTKLPASVKSPKEIAAKELKTLGCPR
jgi:outer membrane protein OmpA-like peptidoglycan-associated protein